MSPKVLYPKIPKLATITSIFSLKQDLLRVSGGRGRPKSKPKRPNAPFIGIGFTSSNKAFIRGSELSCNSLAKSNFLSKKLKQILCTTAG